jgi:hypothetical protein
MAAADAPKKELTKPKLGRPKGSTNKKKQVLIDAIQGHVFKIHGRKDWDAILELAEYASIPWDQRWTTCLDKDGNIIQDANGRPVMVETFDPALKVRCLEQIASFVHPKLKSVEHQAAFMGEAFQVNLFMTVNGEEIGDE